MAAKKALVVDDSAADLANIKSILSDAGCMVVTATSGKEAIDKAKSEHPALIFMDVVMPDMDGYEACRLLAQDSGTKGKFTGKVQDSASEFSEKEGSELSLFFSTEESEVKY